MQMKQAKLSREVQWKSMPGLQTPQVGKQYYKCEKAIEEGPTPPTQELQTKLSYRAFSTFQPFKSNHSFHRSSDSRITCHQNKASQEVKSPAVVCSFDQMMLSLTEARVRKSMQLFLRNVEAAYCDDV